MLIRISYKNGVEFRGKTHFLPLLKVVKKYPFPKPSQVSRTDAQLHWLETEIKSFTDKKILKYLEPIKRHPNIYVVLIDNASEDHPNLSLSQGDESVFIISKVRSFLAHGAAKQLFCDLISCEPAWHYGIAGMDNTSIYGNHFDYAERDTKTMLTWLQYFGKEELEKRGGFAAFESNPYVQTQRIHDGLLVQVGDSPDAFDTPEGEQLLVRAIHALPLIKH
jgi:hypothetical protein